ncbi:CPBP family intramembrane metalloprotease [bacterium]|jgi:uncharacterized protein|nr:CPBP family intramembrane metalloprotease [bacterium]
MNTSKFIKNSKLAQPWVFFCVTYAWSWFFFGIAYLLGISAESGSALGVILILCAISGVAVSGITFVYLALNKEGQKDYWKRVFSFKQISLKWYCAIFFIIPSISIIAAITSGHWYIYSFSHKLPSFFLTLLSIPLVPVLEELGWRGYILDRLQERYSAFMSSIILGTLWWGWHLPLFFLPDSIFKLMPFGSLLFWLYMFNLLSISILFSWIYNNTGRSILSAVLLHCVLEFCANTGIIPWDKTEHVYNVAIWTIFALSISYAYGFRTLVFNIDKKVCKS